MARKRNYKKEYAASKRKAKSAGYKSVRQYSKVRKSLAIPRNASPVPRRVLDRQRPRFIETLDAGIPNLDGMIAASQFWSDHHSHEDTSRFNPDWSAVRILDYHHAYVQMPEGSRRKRGRNKQLRISQYVKKYGYYEGQVSLWKQLYKLDK
jgi:hypothetical protein